MNESRIGFNQERKSSIESKGQIGKIYKPSQNLTAKYNKLLSKANHFPYDLNKTVTSEMVAKKLCKLVVVSYILTVHF
jgi:hypothetical protein